MKKRRMTWMLAVCSAVLLQGASLRGQEVSPPAALQGASAGAPAVQALDKKQVSRMRGKLLYKKSQIRRLERQVAASRGDVAQRASDLERQRRELFVAAEPKLASLYEQQDELDRQIKTAAAQLKKQ